MSTPNFVQMKNKRVSDQFLKKMKKLSSRLSFYYLFGFIVFFNFSSISKNTKNIFYIL